MGATVAFSKSMCVTVLFRLLCCGVEGMGSVGALLRIFVEREVATATVHKIVSDK